MTASRERFELGLESIRRAITTLTKAGALVKTGAKRKGVYGRMEFCWTLPEAKA